MRNKRLTLTLCALSGVLMSIPWLFPHLGAFSLVAFVPLLLAEEVATQCRQKGFWFQAFVCFLVWNAITTFWVCNATVGGGIFAVVVNAGQMLLVFTLFRLARKVFKAGVIPYLFLAALWISWEKLYFSAQISWPWLTLGNAFASSTQSVQWYEYTGTLGGSLWVWACNLGFYGMVFALLNGNWARWKTVKRSAALVGITALVAGPLLVSKSIYTNYEFGNEGSVDVLIAQPNLDPYQKFESYSQAQQDSVLLALFEKNLVKREAGEVLLMGPETFTSGIFVNAFESSSTVKRFREFLSGYDGAELLLGASAYTIVNQRVKPSENAYPYGDGWLLSHNVSFVLGDDTPAIHYKNKLVVGVEMTPYPKLFAPFDQWLCKLLTGSEGNFMGRMEGKGEAELNYFRGIPFGCAICYESVYGDYCREYVLNGAKFMTVITNDAWWGDTPGYRQHFDYSRLRAIELRRDLARCGNTGISGFIDQRGDVVEKSPWWVETTLEGSVALNSKQTFFVRYGDVVGRICELICLLICGLAIVRLITKKGKA